METKPITKIVIAVVASLILVIGGYFGYRGYMKWRQAGLIRDAADYLKKSDDRNAFLCLRSALQYSPNDVQATRLLADLYEDVGSDTVLPWRQRVVKLNPDSLDDQIKALQTAMQMGKFAEASNALEAMSAEQKKTAVYHFNAGALNAALGELPDAEAHYREVARIEPTNKEPLLDIEILHLHSTNDEVATEGRKSLQQMAADPGYAPFHAQAFRELETDAMRRDQTNSALEFSRDLIAQTNSIFTDRLVRLEILRAAGKSGFMSELAETQLVAAKDTANITELVTWQLSQHEATNAMDWLLSLPANTRSNVNVAIVEAECYMETSSWPALDNQLNSQKWDESEYLRYAFRARVLREKALVTASAGEWSLAVKSTHGQLRKLKVLIQLAVLWHWSNESEEVLAAIVRVNPGDTSAFKALVDVLYVRGHTRALMQLYSDKLREEPNNLTARNNMAWAALLLNAREVKPDYLAHQVYQQAPTNAAYVSTYALSLLLQKREAEALNVLEKLDPTELEKPEIAPCYGLVLRATGNSIKAAKYFELGSHSIILPEEQDLIDYPKKYLTFRDNP